jgi:pyruvate dehydrogenase E1 component beta subunit
MRLKTFSESIRETLIQLMKKNKKVILMGLGINDPKGIFGTTTDLSKIFGTNRVIEPPTSESALTGICIGAAIRGLRPILSHQRVEFSLLSIEQIINQAAKWNFMSGGRQKVPLVIRLIIGKGWGQGPQHSQSLEALFAHIPGLKVVAPSNAYDAKGLLVSSVNDDGPVIFFEHRWLHNIKGKVPNKLFPIKIGKAKIIQKGNDLTIVSFSDALIQLMRINKILKKNNINPEIIDLRTIRPIDKDTILKSVKKTKNLLVLDNGWRSFGVSSEIISIISENMSLSLKSNPIRLGIKEMPIPSTRILAKDFYIDLRKILSSVEKLTKKKISIKLIEKYLPIQNINETDIPYKDFKGPF